MLPLELADAPEDRGEPHGVGVPHRAAAVRGEAVAVDVDDVDIDRTCGEALFEDPRPLVDQGVNACCSINSVVTIARANNNIIRRVVAWDSSDGNNEIFGVHAAAFNLLEDVAGFGTARKIFQASEGGNHLTIRRAWGRWDRSTVQGPKETYSLAYNNYWLTCENCLGTWSGQGMPQTYTLLGQHGDGTMGPLGFGKIVVRSGEFDRCVVRKMYAHFIGRDLDPAAEKLYIDKLAAQFAADGRKLRPFIRRLYEQGEFRRGL